MRPKQSAQCASFRNFRLFCSKEDKNATHRYASHESEYSKWSQQDHFRWRT